MRTFFTQSPANSISNRIAKTFQSKLPVIIFVLAAFLLSSSLTAQTNTWTGNSSNNWNTAGNWSAGVPTSAQEVIINKNVSITINISSSSTSINKLTITNNAAVSLVSSGAKTININNSGSSVARGSSLSLTGSGGTMTLSFNGNNQTMAIAGTLVVGSSATFNASNSITSVSGTLKNQSPTGLTAGNNLSIVAGGTYEHGINGGTIPTAAWAATSTLLITGMTNAYPAGMTQSFGNVSFNVASSSALEMNSSLSCAGNLSLANSSTGSLALTNGGNSRNITVGGDFTLASGNFLQTRASGGGTASGDVTVNGNFTKSGTGTYSVAASANALSFTVKGNVSITAGTVSLASGNGAGTWYVAGNFSHTGGTITETSTGAGNIIFNGTGNAQVYTSGGTVSNTINYTVNSAAYLQMAGAATVLSGSSFTLSANAQLGIRSTAGVNTTGATGNIQTTSRSFAAGSHFIYNGTADQATGDALTVTNKANLTIDNPAKVTGNAVAFTLTGNLLVKQGNLLLTATNADYSVAGNVTVQTGATLTHQVSWNDFGFKLTVAGNVAIDGVYSKGTAPRAHVNMNGAGRTVHSGASSFNILTFTNAANTIISADGAITVDDNFWPQWVAAGTFNSNGQKITAYSGMFIAGGKVNLDAGSVVNVTSGIYVGYAGNSGSLNNSAATIQTNGDINIAANGTLVNTSTAGKMALTGNFINDGSFTAGVATVEFNGSSMQYMNLTKPTTFSNVRISNNTTVNATDTVKITGKIDFGAVNNASFITADNVTLVSTASGTASVGDLTNDGANSGNKITGKVNVERYISNGAKWRLLSVPTNTTQSFKQAWQEGASNGNSNPVAGYGVLIGHNNSANYSSNGFDVYTPGGPTVKTYNANSNSWVGINNTNINIKTAGAYMTYSRSSRSGVLGATTIRSKGELYTGTQPIISIGANQFATIGNPYASAIDLTKVNTTGLQEAVYVWDPKAGGGYGLGAYQTLIKMGADYLVFPGGGSYGAQLSVVNTIESGQAFFVKADAAGGTIQFEENDKTISSRLVSRSVSSNTAMLRSTLYAVATDTTTLLDAAMVNFENGFSDATDEDDILKVANGSENVSVNNNGTLLTASRRSDFTANDTIQLNLTGVRVQNYKWVVSMDNITANGRTAFLKDAYTGAITPLNIEGSTEYAFSIVNIAGSYAANRFSIVFSWATVLPVNISTVSATRSSSKTNQVSVSWKVENEINLDKYEIEYSADGMNFASFANLAATAGNSGSSSYGVLHNEATTADNFYRIKAISIGGQVQYSAIVKVAAVKSSSNKSISVYPNPVVNKTMNVQFLNQSAGTYQVQLLSQDGAKVYSNTTTVNSPNQVRTMKLSGSTATGNYQLVVTAADGARTTSSVIIL